VYFISGAAQALGADYPAPIRYGMALCAGKPPVLAT
jgi:hypothetical protein